MEATTTKRQRNVHPISHYWSMVKDMDDSQKLQLVTMLVNSVRTVDGEGSKAKRKLDANDYAGIWDDEHFMPAEDINKAIREARHAKSGRDEFWDKFLNEP